MNIFKIANADSLSNFTKMFLSGETQRLNIYKQALLPWHCYHWKFLWQHTSYKLFPFVLKWHFFATNYIFSQQATSCVHLSFLGTNVEGKTKRSLTLMARTFLFNMPCMSVLNFLSNFAPSIGSTLGFIRR